MTAETERWACGPPRWHCGRPLQSPRRRGPALTTAPPGRASPFPGEGPGHLDPGRLDPRLHSSPAPNAGVAGPGVTDTDPRHGDSLSRLPSLFSPRPHPRQRKPSPCCLSSTPARGGGLNHPGKRHLPPPPPPQSQRPRFRSPAVWPFMGGLACLAQLDCLPPGKVDLA